MQEILSLAKCYAYTVKRLPNRQLKTVLSGTKQARPMCCVREKPYGCNVEIPKVTVERNYAKMKVVTDKENENYGRPFFVCSKENDRCSYFEWGDKCLIKRPVCEHGKPCELHTVEKEGPNYYRSFFCCPRPKNEDCKFFIWFDVFHRPGLRYLRSRNDIYMNTLEKAIIEHF